MVVAVVRADLSGAVQQVDLLQLVVVPLAEAKHAKVERVEEDEKQPS